VNDAPPCPITGEPPRRLIQWVPAGFLNALWRHTFRVDAARVTRGIARFGLWESRAGLVYFDPMLAGDREFYRDLYAKIGAHEALSDATRPEFRMVAAAAAPGTKLLDVGCGEGGLSGHLRGVDYVGLDLHFGGARPNVRAETIEQHAAAHPAAYDLVCSLQVVEHVADPLAFVAAMLKALKPGGRLLLGVPCWPSPMTALPNFALNAPPHHLTWWNEAALRALCTRLGLACRKVEAVPHGEHTALIYWMSRFIPDFHSSEHFRSDWRWNWSLRLAYLLARFASAVRRVPASAPAMELLLVAEKPAA
jgi:2-polyprenyl-3-methyl-5-hydroxy-6-metoxy-1,4-benzoquinol methylase